MKTVLIAGYFDPLHDGHLNHILKAAKLGDFLYIVTHTDSCTERIKKSRYTTLTFRHFILRAILKELSIPGRILVTDDSSVANMIGRFKPNIFAKGGDRQPENMPKSELETCEEVNCQIIYGIGDLLNSSSEIKAKLGGQHDR